MFLMENYMIKKFSEYADYVDNFEDIDIKSIDTESLKKEASQFDVSSVVNMLQKYYGVRVSEALILKIIKENLDMALEVYCNAVTDTCVREQFIDLVLREVGLPNWPLNGDSAEYKIEFRQRLQEVCEKENSEISK